MSLRNFTVFSEHRDLVEEFKKKKKQKLFLKTSSPSLVIDPIPKIKTEYLDHKQKKILDRLIKKLSPTCQNIFRIIKQKSYDNYFASLNSYNIFKIFFLIYKLYPLENNDFKFKNIVLDKKITNKKGLAPHFYAKIFNNIAISDSHYYQEKESPSRLELIQILNKEIIEYHIWIKLWEKISPKLSKGTLLINRESFLLKETAVHLARKGFSIKKINKPHLYFEKSIEKEVEIFNRFIAPNINKLLNDFLSEEKVQILSKIIRKEFINDYKIYFSALSYWKSKVDYFKSINVKAMMETFSKLPVWYALKSILRENNIPIFNFQHGHTKEFCNMFKFASTFGEFVNSDFHFSYNGSTKRCLKFINFSDTKSKVYNVGSPYFQKFKHRFRFKNLGVDNILYVSTNVEDNNNPSIFSQKINSIEKTKDEIEIIEKVFSKIERKIIFKSYPLVYKRKDYIVEKKISKFKNIKYIDNDYDLKYFQNNTKLIITSRGTSTLGWCMMMDKPLIFINYNDEYSVTDEFKKYAITSIFFLERNHENFLNSLKYIISLNDKEINLIWQKKMTSRKKFLRKFFDSNYGGKNEAGKIASDILFKKII